MALLDLTFDTSARTLVRSLTDPGQVNIGTLYQEDGIPLTVRLAKRVSFSNSPIYEAVDLTGYSLVVSVGTAGVVLATQTSWVLNPEANQWSGTVDLNTAGIAALDDGVRKIFEVRAFNGTVYYRAQQVVLIKKGVSTVGAVNPVVNDSALGKQEAAASYLPRKDVVSFTMYNETTGKRLLVYLGDDDALHSDLI